MSDDTALLEAWRAGDQRAGSELFDRYYLPIRRFFRSKVGDEFEELVQVTFTRCVEGQHRFRGEGQFRSYLFSIAANLLRERLRRSYRGPQFDPDKSSVADLQMPAPSSVLGARRESTILLEALRRMPINDQIILELFYWEEMKTAAIAQVLGVPHGTARSRLRLARDRLRGHVDELARTPKELESTVSGLQRWAAELRDRLP